MTSLCVALAASTCLLKIIATDRSCYVQFKDTTAPENMSILLKILLRVREYSVLLPFFHKTAEKPGLGIGKSLGFHLLEHKYRGFENQILRKTCLNFCHFPATLPVENPTGKGLIMKKASVFVLLLAAMLLTGCVERRLTIVTEPAEAVVWLNDEEVGTTPVTVNFNWYGDYRVRIEKGGYEILNTHRKLDRPMHDRFPMDFFAEVLWPGRIEDTYTWDFELEPYRQRPADELIDAALQLRDEANRELGKTAVEILSEQ